MKDDFAATAVLVINQFLGMLALLLGALLEELFKTRQGLVDVTGPCREREVHLRSLELLANLYFIKGSGREGVTTREEGKGMSFLFF